MAVPAILTVSDLNAKARLLLEEGLGWVWIRGELSNCRRPASGHWYFTLRDERTQVRCAMFANRNRFSRMQPADGAEALLRGRVSLYRGARRISDHRRAHGSGWGRRSAAGPSQP